MTPRAKVDDIIDYIRVKHKWGVSDFVRAFATAEAEESYDRSTVNHIKDLAVMVFGKKEKNKEMDGVIRVEEHISGSTMSSGLLPLLHNKMAELQEAEEGFFGKWDITDQSNVDDINFVSIMAKMEQALSLLYGLLKV
jgi:hypothetical protein